MEPTVAIVLYLIFYVLLSLLFLLWIGSILCQCFRIYPYSSRSSGSVGPMIVLFTSNQEVPRGLEPSIIESFPKFPFMGPDTKVDVGVKMAGECVVCLGAYEENETLRLLPKCGHVFHAECVDAWLRSHATCPFCRANLLPEDETGGSTPAPVEVVIDGGRGGG